MNYIIGIAGAKNSGKDTIANIISYIDNVGLSKATYRGWLAKSNVKYNNIIHFADALKELVSKIFRIKLDYFYKRDYKDILYYNLLSNRFIKQIPKNGKEITMEFLDKTYASLEQAIESIKYKSCTPVIKLRTLLQYIGTNIFRNQVKNNIWIDNAILTACDIFSETNSEIVCIADVRFKDEAEAIRKIKNKEIKGFIIKVTRNLSSSENYTHESETVDVDYDFLIENNKSTMELYYKVISIVSGIKKNLM